MLGDSSRNESLIGAVWSPVSLGSVAVLLAVQRQKLCKRDLFLVGAILVTTAILGGRTVPGLIILMLLVRRMFFVLADDGISLKPFSRREVAILVALVVLLVGALGLLAQFRQPELNTAPSSNSEFIYYGGVRPAALQYLVATAGIIGESARVAHFAVPVYHAESGFGLLFTDVFSFLPWFSSTVTAETVDVYRSAGSTVMVSRPGGTPSTLYFIGGESGVVVGGFVYALIFSWLLVRYYTSGRLFYSLMLLMILPVFILGIYGTGTPTSLTVLTLLVVAALVLSSWILDSFRLRRSVIGDRRPY
ncbi:hypothetical protein [Gordonia jacobaea]|uniref:hypothetical protein n=1 Tax=Gordonia jacobaea TaxID=122202 RepID=UPI00128EA869|nr:hypothetical protein [Gordonia jacobaea]